MIATSIYRHARGEVEAVQLARENGRAVWEWADSKPWYGPDRKLDGLSIYTLDGRRKADFGDWIVKSIVGDFYPIKPDTFAATYEPVEQPEEPSASDGPKCGHVVGPVWKDGGESWACDKPAGHDLTEGHTAWDADRKGGSWWVHEACRPEVSR